MRIYIPEKITIDNHVVKNVRLNIPNQYQGRLKCTVERDDGDKDVDIACTQFECKGLDVKSMTWKATAACIDMLTKSPIQINFKYLKLKKRWKIDIIKDGKTETIHLYGFDQVMELIKAL